MTRVQVLLTEEQEHGCWFAAKRLGQPVRRLAHRKVPMERLLPMDFSVARFMQRKPKTGYR